MASLSMSVEDGIDERKNISRTPYRNNKLLSLGLNLLRSTMLGRCVDDWLTDGYRYTWLDDGALIYAHHWNKKSVADL